MNIKEFKDQYDEYVQEDVDVADDYLNKIEKHFLAYLKNPTDKQSEIFRNLRDAFILALLTDLFKKWKRQSKATSTISYDMTKEQVKDIKTVRKDITSSVVKNLYKSKLNSYLADVTYVLQAIKTNSEQIISEIESNLEQSRKQVSLEIMQEYKKYGITYFTKTDGSRMDISNYVKMKTSDVVISTFRNAFFAEMLAKGVELVQVKRLPTTAVECDNCRPYDEKVLSLQEKEGYESIATAKMNGLFHNNCWHYTIPFVDEPTEEQRTIKHSEDNKKTYARNIKKGIKKSLID